MIAVLVGNANLPPIDRFRQSLKDSTLLIAADGGANFCHELEVIPHLIVGDMDSIKDSVRVHFREASQFLIHPPEKDDTDLELAYKEALKKGAQEIHVYSWADERIDYSLGTIYAFSESPAKIRLFTERSEIILVNPFHPNLSLEGTQKVSVFPIHYPLKLQSTGLQWELNWESSQRQRPSQSNRVLKKAQIGLTEGAAFVVLESK